ncbi:MAG: metallophosphoesterase family protein [Promethearchaeota archaeon]
MSENYLKVSESDNYKLFKFEHQGLTGYELDIQPKNPELLRILHISDIEGRKIELNKELVGSIDLILLSGDISVGAKSLTRNVRVLNKIAELLPKNVPLFFIPGNREYDYMAKEFEGIPEQFYPVHNRILHIQINSGKDILWHTLKHIFVLSLGGAIPGFNNNFVLSEEEIKSGLGNLYNHLNSLKEIIYKKQSEQQEGDIQERSKRRDALILMTHVPPINTEIDFARTNFTHIGSKSIREFIEEKQPDLCVCGHVHESGGIIKLNRTICVNPGATKFGNAAIVDIDIKMKPKESAVMDSKDKEEDFIRVEQIQVDVVK